MKEYLTEYQKKHLSSIEWLISDSRKDRASGRSYVLAFAFIKKALRQKGSYVKVFDHHPYIQSNKDMVGLIRIILYGYKTICSRLKIRTCDNCFMIKRYKEII